MSLSFDYKFSPINDLHVETTEDPKTGKVKVKHMLVQDEPIKTSERFWSSLYARYGFSGSIFKYFSHHEVFERISQREAHDRLRLCVERTVDDDGKPTNRLLAISNPKNPLVVHDELVELLGRYNTEGISYLDGKVESVHSPRAGGGSFDILGDKFENRFMMSTPIDGYGSPNIYLSLLRLACANGMVAYARTFRSTLALGKASDEVSPTITRALDGFNSDDGFAAVRQRVESAGTSWCSMYESESLYKLLVKLHSNKLLDVNDKRMPKGTTIADYLKGDQKARRMGESADTIGSPLIKAFHRMTGDPAESYGLANLDALSAKRQHTLPVDCTMYDALNFATEAATHYALPAGARQLQAWVGTRIADEYDMEGTTDQFKDFADFLVDSKLKAGLTGSR